MKKGGWPYRVGGGGAGGGGGGGGSRKGGFEPPAH